MLLVTIFLLLVGIGAWDLNAMLGYKPAKKAILNSKSVEKSGSNEGFKDDGNNVELWGKYEQTLPAYLKAIVTTSTSTISTTKTNGGSQEEDSSSTKSSSVLTTKTNGGSQEEDSSSSKSSSVTTTKTNGGSQEEDPSSSKSSSVLTTKTNGGSQEEDSSSSKSSSVTTTKTNGGSQEEDPEHTSTSKSPTTHTAVRRRRRRRRIVNEIEEEYEYFFIEEVDIEEDEDFVELGEEIIYLDTTTVHETVETTTIMVGSILVNEVDMFMTGGYELGFSAFGDMYYETGIGIPINEIQFGDTCAYMTTVNTVPPCR